MHRLTPWYKGRLPRVSDRLRRRRIVFQLAGFLVLLTVCGSGAGSDSLSSAHPSFLIVALAILVVVLGVFAAYLMVRLKRIDPERDRLATIVEAREDREERAVAIFRTVMERLPVGVMAIDANGMITYANPAAGEMFGYENGLAECELESLVPVRFRGHHTALRAEYMDAPVAREMGRDLSALRKDGGEFPVEVALTPLPRETPGGGRIMATVVDITARKESEQALAQRTRQLERSNRELDSFAHVASHDLKSPLRGIESLATWIEEDLGGNASGDIREHLHLLHGRVRRMERLLDDLLEYSRIGRGLDQVRRVDVRALVTEAAELLGPPAGFQVRIDGELPVLETLATPLGQVFRNLINNAIKHHDKSMGEIIVGAEDKEPFIEFYVADDGPGIEEAYRERIFRMFSTLRPRDDVEGSGLGLAVVGKIVENRHGRVWVEDRDPERGALFRFTWPKRIDPEEAWS